MMTYNCITDLSSIWSASSSTSDTRHSGKCTEFGNYAESAEPKVPLANKSSLQFWSIRSFSISAMCSLICSVSRTTYFWKADNKIIHKFNKICMLLSQDFFFFGRPDIFFIDSHLVDYRHPSTGWIQIIIFLILNQIFFYYYRIIW